jgi:hypothetical protein
MTPKEAKEFKETLDRHFPWLVKQDVPQEEFLLGSIPLTQLKPVTGLAKRAESVEPEQRGFIIGGARL